MSRPRIFTVFNLNEVYLPLVDVQLVDSAYISVGFKLSWVRLLVQMKSGWQSEFFCR